MRPHGSPEALEARRRIAARLLAQGDTLTEVAAAVDASVSSVKRWRSLVEEYGALGLQAKPHPGRKAMLTEQQQQRLLVALNQGTRHWGYRLDGWTARLARDLIRRLFGVEYHVDHVGRLLHKLGWSPQKPEHRARERDEREIARWFRDVWPRLKKEHRTTS